MDNFFNSIINYQLSTIHYFMIDENDFRSRMEKIETLTEEVEALPDRNARTKAVELVQALMDYHGAAIERIMEIVADNDTDGKVFEGLANNELASSLLLLYGLHPLEIETRVGKAVENVRPFLQSQKGNVELIGVEDGVVRLRLFGNCNGCPSSSATLTQAIEKAIYEAAPDIAAIETEAAEEKQTSGLVQIQGIQHTAAT